MIAKNETPPDEEDKYHRDGSADTISPESRCAASDEKIKDAEID